MCDRLPSGSVQPTTTNSSRLRALRFDPDPAVAWRIGPICLLGDGALQTQLAGLCAEGRTVTGNVFAVAQPTNLLLEQPLQPFLALDKR